MEKKSGFLASVNRSNSVAVHYQCKSCLSFLASTGKWDQHLAKCFSKDRNFKGNVPRPVGFRMVPFTEPILSLKRIQPGQKSYKPEAEPIVNRQFQLNSLSDLSNPIKRKPGRPKKYVNVQKPAPEMKIIKFGKPHTLNKHIGSEKNENIQGQTAKKRGRPRKVPGTYVRESKVNVAPPELLVIADGLKRLRRPREEWTESDKSDKMKMTKTFKKQGRPGNVISVTLGGKIIRKRAVGRPRKVPVDSIKMVNPDQATKNVKKKYLHVARKHKRINHNVKSFKYACHLCPAKFEIQLFLNTHVNSIHNGKRKLMECCVCGRIFNKRDSLNSHYLSHEASEAREEKFDLFHPWDDTYMEKIKLYRMHYQSTTNIHQHTCKVCLLNHYTHYSYRTHFLQEHADPPEAFTLTCKFDNCSNQFKSIKVYLDHAKSKHAKQFHGSLTLFRQTRGAFIGKRVVPINEHGDLLYKQRVFHSKADKKRTPSNKRLGSFTPREDEGSDWEEENHISLDSFDRLELEQKDENPGPVEIEKKFELECVHLDDAGDAHVKQEIHFKAKVENVEVVFSDAYNNRNQLQEGILPVESEPVAFGIVDGDLMY